MVKVLVTRPKIFGDEATNHTYYWGSSIVKKAKQMGHEVFDYKHNATTYEKVNQALSLHNPDVFIHLGHGCPSSLVGQKSCIISNDKKIEDYKDLEYEDIYCGLSCDIVPNVKLLKNKIVIAIACHSAKRLGKCAMKYGAKAYIGFDDYLMFMVDSKNSEKLFKEPILEFTNSLLEGETLETSKIVANIMYDKNIIMYKDVKFLSRLLMWDKISFKVYGDPELTIFS